LFKEDLEMKRMLMFVVALAVAGVMVTNGPLAAAAPIVYFFDFNKTLAPFETYPVTAPGDGQDTGALALNYRCYAPIDRPGVSGVTDGCARLTLRLDGSFISLLAPLKGQGRTISVDFSARDLDGRGATGIIVYAENGKPASVGNFQQVGPLLSTVWTHYGYQAMLTGNNPVVAIGITRVGDGPTWVQHAGIDNLRVRFLDH
jgi:hypothetical protein